MRAGSIRSRTQARTHSAPARVFPAPRPPRTSHTVQSSPSGHFWWPCALRSRHSCSVPRAFAALLAISAPSVRSALTCQSVNVGVEPALEFGFVSGDAGGFVGASAVLLIFNLFLAFAGGERVGVVCDAKEDLRGPREAIEGDVVPRLLRIDVLKARDRQIEREIENALDAFRPRRLPLFRLFVRAKIFFSKKEG